jgi:hypothetical protein
MLQPDFLRTAGFRWGVAVAGILAAVVLLLLSFVYWQSTTTLLSPLDSALASTAAELAPATTHQILSNFEDHTDHDPRRVKLRGLFDAAGHRIGGNLVAVPPRLTLDGVAHTVQAVRSDTRGLETETIRAVAGRLPDGRILVIGRDIDELLDVLTRIGRILLLALVPAMLMSIGGGVLAGLRAQRRLTILRRAAARIMAGHLGERANWAARSRKRSGVSTRRWTSSWRCCGSPKSSMGVDMRGSARWTWARSSRRLESCTNRSRKTAAFV